ncbi:related to SEC7, component of non-clathrin vesicle coat [Fusarium torulosum]|uniref:Related to SEC7, component of non-clathrin vesicle coat n=1 Tax=Fusarium torulosum TaxID=33205 RepID=A0AAE8M5K7_9HYPO|nr:related to SEC7, component of non-clathrin vesicle coat [Fusarium torulosum]
MSSPSFSNTPLPHDNARRRTRRRPHTDLNINTNTASLASPLAREREPIPQPRTPPPQDSDYRSSQSKSKSKSSRNTHTSTGNRAPTKLPAHTHESFLENATPVEEDMADRLPKSTAHRDSHDLSLSPRNVTRDSLVANMLMSLDQFSMAQLSDKYGPSSTPGSRSHTFDETTPQFVASEQTRSWVASTSVAGQPRPTGHQYSYSSDLEGADDSSRISSRGRRSNSSSNFQSSFARLNSVREGHKAGSRAMHSRGGKPGSKSSSTASVDAGYVQVLGSQRYGRGFGRSASFDYGPQHQPSSSQPPAIETPPFRVEFPNSYIDDEYDAAPTPNVPGGPRREPSIPTMSVTPSTIPPPMPPAPLEPPTLDHKRSSRSLKSVSGRKPATSREPTPAVPVLDLDSAPAPSVGYGKSKEAAVHSGPTPATHAPAPVKERPGFFRRVFGSSRNNSHNSVESTNPPTSQSNPPVENKVAGNASTPPSRDTSSSHSHHPTLQKKPSSFFRRRKKSVTEDTPPLPMMPTAPVPTAMPNLAPQERDATFPPNPSPVSSLRKVMNPYIRSGQNPQGTPGPQGPSPLADISNMTPERDDRAADREEYKREFSPDYSPSPNARIRTVRSESDEQLDKRNNMDMTPSRPPAERPTKTFESRNNSFLNLDGMSDNEEERGLSSRKLASMSKSKPESTPARDIPRGGKDHTRSRKSSQPAEQSDSEDEQGRSNLALPIEGARASSPGSASTGTDYKSALSAPPSVRIESSADPSPKIPGTFDAIKNKGIDEPEFVIGDPTEDDRQKAQRIYDGNEDFISKEKAASFMGEEGPIRQRTLQAYMELYDFTNQSIVQALRQVCGRLIFRAETQQVDRILVAFSKRWCDCNPRHGFKATDVIHTICYSIMLLNTDLHMADIEHKMTRSQFIKNTMATILQAVDESAPDAFHRPSILPDGNDNQEPLPEQDRRSFRHSFRPPARADSGTLPAEGIEDCGPLIKTPFTGTKKAWEEQIETVLKGIYTSIKDERLPLFGAESEKNANLHPTNSGLSVMGMLKRSPSVLSKAPSESQLSVRGRINENGRNTTGRWTSKSRSRAAMSRNGFSSSRTSFDDGNSLWSPTASSATWSRHSLGRTQTSVSQDSFGSHLPRNDYQQSIGFANALSQAIIRDEEVYGDGAPSIMSSDLPATQLLEDESLELAGPPWVKEGMVTHKHHLDGVDKKAKARNWSEVFAVIQKGQLNLFSFQPNKSVRARNRGRNARNGPTIVGGGNWQDNATNLGCYNLRQTLASALPPPGYSRARPHVWALSLPNGAVHLFQVGTPEICKEFVTTANYWSARLSTHPLTGGISNIEYGWSEAIVNNALVSAINETAPGKTSRPGSSAAHGRRSSVNSGSFRNSSFDHVAGAFTNNSGRGKLPGDRIHIAEWTPPTQSMRPSNQQEADQLQTLDAYVKGIEAELQTHNRLRSPMLLAFTPRGSNAVKAMANWERKSAYLLREIVKFTTYVDCLRQADARKQEIYSERDLAQRAARGELSDGDMDVSSEDEGDLTLRP